MNQKSRIYLWDNLKVLSMFFVVVTHCICPYQLNDEYWVQFLWIFIMTFTMPLFTLISGYFYKERCLRFSVERYLYPCILFSVLNYMIAFYCGVSLRITPKAGFAMWYIWVLFVYNLITPVLLRKMSEKKLLVLSFFVAFICGFKFISNEYFNAPRMVAFYPFFVIGIFLKKNTLQLNRKMGVFLLVVCFIIYFILTLKIHGFPYGTGFMGIHGLSLKGFFARWANYFLTIVMSLSLIAIMPKKKLWFTQLGTRTMNVYLLHMAIVFPICWYFLKPYMHYWWGYVLYIVVVPLFVSVCLFSEFIDKRMQVLLTLPQRFLRKKGM